MTSQINPYTIQQVSELTGLSIYTLRYYERIKLIPPVERDENGYRRYSQANVDLIKFLCCLIQTKMPLDQVKKYALLVLQGAESEADRAAILTEHREAVLRQIDDLTNTLATIDKKLARFHLQHRQEPVKEDI